MPFATLALHFPAPGVLLLSLSRETAANALNTAMAAELAECLANLAAGVQAVVLTGAGRHFCAGADLKEREGMDANAWEAQHRTLRAARDVVLACPLPVIAAVNGAAYGGGLELALACDFIYAAPAARFALPEARLGIMPGLGGTALLARAVGERRAKELLFTGNRFTAEEAYGWGMINRLCAPERLVAEAVETAAAMAACAPLALRALKRVAAAPLADAFLRERAEYQVLVESTDRVEGINAFNEKRPPRFSGA